MIYQHIDIVPVVKGYIAIIKWQHAWPVISCNSCQVKFYFFSCGIFMVGRSAHFAFNLPCRKNHTYRMRPFYLCLSITSSWQYEIHHVWSQMIQNSWVSVNVNSIKCSLGSKDVRHHMAMLIWSIMYNLLARHIINLWPHDHFGVYAQYLKKKE